MKNKNIWLGLVVFTISIISISTNCFAFGEFTLNTFNNSQTETNITFNDGINNEYEYFYLPARLNMSVAKMNATGTNRSMYIYQEDPNTTWMGNDHWIDVANIYDGGWTSYGRTEDGTYSTYNLNYTAPENSTGNPIYTLRSLWFDQPLTNGTIDKNTYITEEVHITIWSSATSKYVRAYCDERGGGSSIIISNGGASSYQHRMYEEGIYWYITGRPLNFEMDIGNNTISEYTKNGDFNSEEEIELNKTTFYNYLQTNCDLNEIEYCYVPIEFYSEDLGIIELKSLNITGCLEGINLTFSSEVDINYAFPNEIGTKENTTTFVVDECNIGDGTVQIAFNNNTQLIEFINTEENYLNENVGIFDNANKVQNIRIWDGISLIEDANVYVYNTDNQLVYSTVTDIEGASTVNLESGTVYKFIIVKDGYYTLTENKYCVPLIEDTLVFRIIEISTTDEELTLYSNCSSITYEEIDCSIMTSTNFEAYDISYNYEINGICCFNDTANYTTSNELLIRLNKTLYNYTINLSINDILQGNIYKSYKNISEANITTNPPIENTTSFAYAILSMIAILISALIAYMLDNYYEGICLYAFAVTLAIFGVLFTAFYITAYIIFLLIAKIIVERLL